MNQMRLEAPETCGVAVVSDSGDTRTVQTVTIGGGLRAYVHMPNVSGTGHKPGASGRGDLHLQSGGFCVDMHRQGEGLTVVLELHFMLAEVRWSTEGTLLVGGGGFVGPPFTQHQTLPHFQTPSRQSPDSPILPPCHSVGFSADLSRMPRRRNSGAWIACARIRFGTRPWRRSRVASTSGTVPEGGARRPASRSWAA